MIAALMLFVACSSNKEDRWGGGEVSISFSDDGGLIGTHVLSGASVECMKDSFCQSPHIALDSINR